MKILFLYLLGLFTSLSFLCSSCDGNFSLQGTGRYENNSTSERIVIQNGDTILDDRSKKHSHGGGEINIKSKSDKHNQGGDAPDNDDVITNDDPSSDDVSTKLKFKIDCPSGISNDEFINLKERLRKEFMDDDRLTKAKKLFNERCISAAQVRDITLMFMMDDAKLDFAKFAYGRTTDRINFSKVNEAFSFTSTKKQLTQYVNEQ